jgi:AraC-like DNA-binding protein
MSADAFVASKQLYGSCPFVRTCRHRPRNASVCRYDSIHSIEAIAMSAEPHQTTSKVVPIDRAQAELLERVRSGAASEGANETALPGVAFMRTSEVGQPRPSVYAPSLAVVVQGRKRTIMGGESFYYDPFSYLLVSVTLPMSGQILDATQDRPFLSVRVHIDVPEVSRLMLEIADRNSSAQRNDTPVYVGRMNTELMDVILRLVRLLDTPQDIPVLCAMALRELWYRLLRGDMGSRLRDLVELEGPVQRISRSIELLRTHYDQPLRVEDLAAAAHMSVSNFHAHFKAVTTLSPLQFLKRLRLHEARTLMMSEQVDAASAAHRVGYASPSQFNREYRRLFGSPPRRDLAELRLRR